MAAALEVVSAAAQPEVFALVAAAVEPSPEVLVSAAEPEAAFAVAEPEVLALVSVVAEPSLGALVLAAALEVSSAAVEPEVFALVSVADAAEPQAFVDIAVAFVVLVPVSVAVVEVDSSGHPKFPAFPNVCHYASSSNSVEAAGKEFARSSIGAHTNCGLCSILSNRDLHRNKNLEHRHNNPSPGHNNMIDTTGLPTDATTNHSRKTCLHLY